MQLGFVKCAATVTCLPTRDVVLLVCEASIRELVRPPPHRSYVPGVDGTGARQRWHCCVGPTTREGVQSRHEALDWSRGRSTVPR